MVKQRSKMVARLFCQQRDRPVVVRTRTFFDFERQAMWDGVRLTLRLQSSWQPARDRLSPRAFLLILVLDSLCLGDLLDICEMNCCGCVSRLLVCSRDVHLQLPEALCRRRSDCWIWPLPLLVRMSASQHRDLHSSLLSPTTRLVLSSVVLRPLCIVTNVVVLDGQITKCHLDGDCRFNATLLTSVPHSRVSFLLRW